MEKKLDLGFCDLVYSSKDNSLNIEKKLLIDSYNINKKFAKIEIPKFQVKLIYSRKIFEELWGFKTPRYVSAFVKNDSIVIFSYDVFEKETKWKKEKFQEALIHEISHLFYQELRDDEYDPLWLSEGLATFLQHGKKKFNYKEKLKIKKEILSQKFEEMTFKSYQIFALFVEYLVLNFREDKLLKLIMGLKRGEKINDLFKKIYKKSFEILIEDGNKYHKIT